MQQPIYIHKTHQYELQPPSPWPPLVAGTLGLLMVIGFGVLAASGLSGNSPSWLGDTDLSRNFRILLAVLGLGNGVLGILVASSYLTRAWDFFRCRFGAYPVIDSQGPCRIVQEGADSWGLELTLEDTSNMLALRPEFDHRSQCRLFFRLDEAEVAGISRLFNPEEDLRIRWIDLPVSAGGPTLLGLQTSAREESIFPELLDEEIRRVA